MSEPTPSSEHVALLVLLAAQPCGCIGPEDRRLDPFCAPDVDSDPFNACADAGWIACRHDSSADGGLVAITAAGRAVLARVKPVRLQLSRAKGFDLQAASRAANGRPAVVVARPSKWGNPVRVGMFAGFTAADAVRAYRQWFARELAVRSYENAFGKPPTIEQIRGALAGKNLACWCRLDAPCHADVLLDLANRPACVEVGP